MHNQQIAHLEGEPCEDLLVDRDKSREETLEQKRERAYLRASCLMRRHRWDEAAQSLLPQEISGETIEDLQELGRSERRRSSSYLLVLGEVAFHLTRYEEAIEHYTQCITFLDERRMNDTNRRIRALLDLNERFACVTTRPASRACRTSITVSARLTAAWEILIARLTMGSEHCNCMLIVRTKSIPAELVACLGRCISSKEIFKRLFQTTPNRSHRRYTPKTPV